MSASCLLYAEYVPTGPPPARRDFIAYCRHWQRELLWARQDKRNRRRAAETIRYVWHTMGYMAGKKNVPPVQITPEQLMRLRPEQAAGEALRALAVAIDWAERRADPASGTPHYGSEV